MLLAVLKPLAVLTQPWPFRNGQINLMAISTPRRGIDMAWLFQNHMTDFTSLCFQYRFESISSELLWICNYTIYYY